MENNQLPELVKSFLDSKGVEEELKEKIYQAVLALLMYDTTKLYNVLYRIDINESLVKQAFNDSPTAETAASRLTALIIERQLQKIEFRTRYPKNDIF